MKTHRTITPSLSRLTHCIYCTIIDLVGVTFRAKDDPSQGADTQSESVVYIILETGHLWTRFHNKITVYLRIERGARRKYENTKSANNPRLAIPGRSVTTTSAKSTKPLYPPQSMRHALGCRRARLARCLARFVACVPLGSEYFRQVATEKRDRSQLSLVNV